MRRVALIHGKRRVSMPIWRDFVRNSDVVEEVERLSQQL